MQRLTRLDHQYDAAPHVPIRVDQVLQDAATYRFVRQACYQDQLEARSKVLALMRSYAQSTDTVLCKSNEAIWAGITSDQVHAYLHRRWPVVAAQAQKITN
jgi:hypothetical protein